MATNKNPETSDFALITKIEFYEDGTIQSIFADAQPGEEEAVTRRIPHLIQVDQTAQTGKPAVTADAPRLGAEMEKFINEHANGGNWRGPTVLDVRGGFDQVLALLGDVPVATPN